MQDRISYSFYEEICAHKRLKKKKGGGHPSRRASQFLCIPKNKVVTKFLK